MGIEQTYGHDDMSGPHVKLFAEGLLDPELFQCHLATFFYLLFPLAPFGEFFLLGTSRTGMFKLDFRRHGPSFAEVITYVNHGMGNVKPAVTRVVGIFLGVAVAIHVVAVEIARECHLAISAHLQLGLGRQRQHCYGAQCCRNHLLVCFHFPTFCLSFAKVVWLGCCRNT